jgi:hypothetical protein
VVRAVLVLPHLDGPLQFLPVWQVVSTVQWFVVTQLDANCFSEKALQELSIGQKVELERDGDQCLHVTLFIRDNGRPDS